MMALRRMLHTDDLDPGYITMTGNGAKEENINQKD